MPCCRIDELPHSLCACAGYRRRIQCRFDDGHGLELLWKPVCDEDFFENRHVIGGEAEYLAYGLWHLFRILDYVVLDDGIVRERNERVHLFEPADVYGVRYVRGVSGLFEIRGRVVIVEPALHVVDAEQRIHGGGTVPDNQVVPDFFFVLAENHVCDTVVGPCHFGEFPQPYGKRVYGRPEGIVFDDELPPRFPLYRCFRVCFQYVRAE